jgi:hypothetical protein
MSAPKGVYLEQTSSPNGVYPEQTSAVDGILKAIGKMDLVFIFQGSIKILNS